VERVKTWLAGKGIGSLSDEETARAIMRALKSGKTADEFSPRLLDTSRGYDDSSWRQNDDSDLGDAAEESGQVISRYNLTKVRVLNPTKIEQFETLPYGQFRKFPRDRLAGHELLQNAWLRQHGYGGRAFPRNPALALPQKFHVGFVTPMLAGLGLHYRINLANMTAEENILFNAEILRRLNVPHAAIEQAVNASLQYAKTLSKTRP